MRDRGSYGAFLSLGHSHHPPSSHHGRSAITGPPRPLFISENPKLFWSLIASMYIGNIILVALNLPLIGLFVSLAAGSFRILFPVILFICLIGTIRSATVLSPGHPPGIRLFGCFFRKLEYDLALSFWR